jgi:hypothetical protein
MQILDRCGIRYTGYQIRTVAVTINTVLEKYYREQDATLARNGPKHDFCEDPYHTTWTPFAAKLAQGHAGWTAICKRYSHIRSEVTSILGSQKA